MKRTRIVAATANDAGSRTFTRRDDGSRPVMIGLGIFFAALIGGRGLWLAAHHDRVASGSFAGVLVVLVVTAAIVIAFAHRARTLQITYAADRISWSDAWGNGAVEVADVESCLITTHSGGRAAITVDRLIFRLKNGTVKKTPSFAIALYPGMIGELKRRYGFTIRSGHPWWRIMPPWRIR